MTSALSHHTDDLSQLNGAASEVDLTSFATFSRSFPLQGEHLYVLLFKRHAKTVQTLKARFAVSNLEKILTATFEISSTSGFNKMSLRDLSKRTGMSMGRIYSCITKKEDIALMVADIVRLSGEMTRQHVLKESSLWSQIEQSIRFHLYASTLLQPWYFFLYFETRSLPVQQQTESKQIELGAIKSFESQIIDGVASGEFHTNDARMVANSIVVLLEDWYLKPWKTQAQGRIGPSSMARRITIEQQEQRINNYHQSLTGLVKKLLTSA